MPEPTGHQGTKMREPTEEEMKEMERLFLRSMTIPRAMAIRQHESAVYASIVEYQQARNAEASRPPASTAQTSNSQTDAGQTHASEANGVPVIEIQDYDAAQVANTQIDQGQANEGKGNGNGIATMEVDNDSPNQVEDDDCMEIDPPRRVRPIHYLQLTPIDHTVSRDYTHVYLCFPFDGDEEMAYAAYQHLGAAYRFALAPWPFLAGEVINSDPQDPGILQVKYHSSVEAEDLDRCMGKKVIFGELDWKYEQLTRWGAPPEWFVKAFGSFPAGSDEPSDGCPASALRLTYVHGGLIVGFAFHRAVVDGCSIRQFLHAFAAGTIKGKKQWKFDLSNRVQDRYKMLDFFLPKKGYSESDFVKGKGKALSKGYDPLHHCEEYDMTPVPEPTVSPEPTTAPTPAALEPILVGGKIFIPDVPDNYEPRDDTLPPKPYTHVVLEFKNVIVRQLHSRVKYFLEEIDSPYEVSRVECFCGLLWVAIMRARAHRLPKDTVVRFTTAVDARNRVGRAVKEDWLPLWYMGNFSVAAVAKTTLGNLIGDEEHRVLSMTGNKRKPMWKPKIHEVLGIRNDITIEAVANAAVLIRRSIDIVNADYVKHRLAITLDDATRIRDTRARARAADSADTGVDFSSWNNWLWGSLERADELLEMEEENNRGKLNGTMRFEIPGVKKQAFPDFARTSELEAEGACVLLPRWNPGGAKNAPWEVALHLQHEEMMQLRWVTELGGWAAKVYDRDVGEIVEENKNTVLAAESNGEWMRKDLERYWREKQVRFWYFRVGERVFPRWHADWERRKAEKEAEWKKKKAEKEAKAQAEKDANGNGGEGPVGDGEAAGGQVGDGQAEDGEAAGDQPEDGQGGDAQSGDGQGGDGQAGDDQARDAPAGRGRGGGRGRGRATTGRATTKRTTTARKPAASTTAARSTAKRATAPRAATSRAPRGRAAKAQAEDAQAGDAEAGDPQAPGAPASQAPDAQGGNAEAGEAQTGLRRSKRIKVVHRSDGTEPVDLTEG